MRDEKLECMFLMLICVVKEMEERKIEVMEEKKIEVMEERKMEVMEGEEEDGRVKKMEERRMGESLKTTSSFACRKMSLSTFSALWKV